MKKLTIFAFLGMALLGFSFELFAAFPVVVKSVKQTGDLMPYRTIDRQVTTHFVIEVEECAHKIARQFAVKVSPDNNRALPSVTFVDHTSHRCDLDKRWEEITLSTTELPLIRKVAIVNPVVGIVVNVEDRRTTR